MTERDLEKEAQVEQREQSTEKALENCRSADVAAACVRAFMNEPVSIPQDVLKVIGTKDRKEAKDILQDAAAYVDDMAEQQFNIANEAQENIKHLTRSI